MGFRIELVRHYFATCDWCHKEVVTNLVNEKDGFHMPEPELPQGWERDWDAVNGTRQNDPPIYCSTVHMERARQVAALRALP